jgi:hypothetical protein
MKRSTIAAAGLAAAVTLGMAATAIAHPGMVGGGMGPMGKGGMGPGAMMRGGFAGPMAGQQLMSAEERTAMLEKMRAAGSPEERRKLGEANRAEMEKRAKEKGVTLPGFPHQH